MSSRPKPIMQVILAFTAIAVFQCCCCFFPVRWRVRPPRFSNDMIQQVDYHSAGLAEKSLRINALPRGSRSLNSPDGGLTWIDLSETAETAGGVTTDPQQARIWVGD